MRSATVPVLKPSEETTIAGRFLPGSPDLAAPSDTSHTSPRRGSVDAIGQRNLPEAHLLQSVRVLNICANRLPLGLEDRLAGSIARYIRQQGGQRYATRTRLLGQ